MLLIAAYTNYYKSIAYIHSLLLALIYILEGPFHDRTQVSSKKDDCQHWTCSCFDAVSSVCHLLSDCTSLLRWWMLFVCSHWRPLSSWLSSIGWLQLRLRVCRRCPAHWQMRQPALQGVSTEWILGRLCGTACWHQQQQAWMRVGQSVQWGPS